MDLNGIIRGLFGFNRHYPNSDWQEKQHNSDGMASDKGDDETAYPHFHRTNTEFPDFAQFHAFVSDPLQMFDQLEQQLEGMMRNFEEVFSTPFLSQTPFSSPAESNILTEKELGDTDSNLRNQMLKPNARQGWGSYDSRKEKRDEDLDPLVAAGGLDALAECSPKSKQVKDWTNAPSVFSNSSESQSVSTSVSTRDVNGAVEKKTVTRFSDGTQETVITQQLGDSSFMIKLRKRPGEAEEREEHYQNLEPGSITVFQDEWTRRTGQQSVNPDTTWSMYLSPDNFIKGIMRGVFG